MTPNSSKIGLDERIQKLEQLYAVLKANMDLLDPKKMIEFQAGTVEAIKALKNAIKENRDAANRRTTISISIAVLVLSAIQIVIAAWPK